ncbi:hypothetical protein [Leptolyngbya sp. FACHB-16]|uniref:hypothetical protein n=1 Tax=unclassified Leptolyngbya TaxID=2650499 RepID=UPI001689463D|nr:hypothetical protein [Leptolyngbya sp. FACHB-16]MBD2158875.1 hypothetical protein [Leptolyngbya sp. FACHB-16]
MTQNQQMNLHQQTVFISLILGMAEEDKRKLVVLRNPESPEFKCVFQNSIDLWKEQCPEEATAWESRYGKLFNPSPIEESVEIEEELEETAPSEAVRVEATEEELALPARPLPTYVSLLKNAHLTELWDEVSVLDA